MRECIWKDGKFYSCDGFDPENGNRHHDGYRVYCRGCGKSIDKPEPEVIICKSGGTWVARYDGVEYLCMRKPNLNHWDIEEDFNMYRDNIEYWKSISEIEITDEIAKLNPLVVSDAYGLCHLIAISRNEIFIVSDINDGEWGCRTTEPRESLKRLATVSDLEES